MKWTLFLVMILSFSLHAQTMGQGGGNGGDVVVCKKTDGTILSAKLLDVYEAKEMRGIILDLGASTLSLEQKLQLVVKRAKVVSPGLATYLENEYKSFFENSRFIDGIILNDIPDSDHLYIPKGCEVQQIAIQKEPSFPEDKRYIVSNDLWKVLDADNQLALILHEVLYKAGIKNYHTNSIRIRYLNSLVFSTQLAKYPGEEFAKLMRELALQEAGFSYLYQGLEFKSNEYNPDSMFIGGFLVKPQDFLVMGNKLHVDRLEFYKKTFGGELRSVNLVAGLPQKVLFKNAQGEPLVEALAIDQITFHSNGKLKSLFTNSYRAAESKVWVLGQAINFGHYIEFNDREDASGFEAMSPFYAEFLGNRIPLFGTLYFTNGELSPGHTYKIWTETEIKIKNISFSMTKFDDIYRAEEEFIFSFNGYSSFVDLAVQPNQFQCAMTAGFFPDGTLNSCRVAAKGEGINFLKPDASHVNVQGGDWVVFNREGYVTSVITP